MMTLNESYEVELPVPMKLVGVPKNVVMTSAMSDTVRVTVRDKGFALLSYEAYRKLRPLRFSFLTYANKQTGKGQVAVTDIQRLVRQQLYGSTSISSIKADKLDFSFNYGQNRRIKVKLVGHVVPSENYYLSHVQIEPDFVTVYASKEVLDKLGAVATQSLNLTNFYDTVQRVVNLAAVEGAKIVPSKVKVTLYADVLTEGSVEVPITTINKPANLTIRTFPQSVTVSYTVGAKVYRFVKASDFDVVADYNEISAHPSDKCNLTLKSRSRFARNPKLETTQVDYLIEQQ